MKRSRCLFNSTTDKYLFKTECQPTSSSVSDHCKCKFPMSQSFPLSVGRLVRHNFIKRKLCFHAPIGALVSLPDRYETLSSVPPVHLAPPHSPLAPAPAPKLLFNLCCSQTLFAQRYFVSVLHISSIQRSYPWVHSLHSQVGNIISFPV